MSEAFREKARELIKAGEGCIQHMYLDTVGKVTVGVGNMLPNAAAATQLPFIHADDLTEASDEEIRTEFDLVSTQTAGLLASKYKSFTKLMLSEPAIDDLLDERIDGFESQLKIDFPNYESCPEPARLGMLDMAFNLGNAGLVNKFPSFTRAARQENWSECELQCNRRGIAESRNNEVKGLFQACVAPAD